MHRAWKEVNHTQIEVTIINESEDATSGKTIAQTKTSTESDKGHMRTFSGRGGRGDRGNAINNTRDSSASTNKYYKVEIEAFGAVLALNYQKVELKRSFDVFRE